MPPRRECPGRAAGRAHQPPAVDAAVPVEAAEERSGGAGAGRAIFRPLENLVGACGDFPGDVAERDVGEAGGDLGREEVRHRASLTHPTQMAGASAMASRSFMPLRVRRSRRAKPPATRRTRRRPACEGAGARITDNCATDVMLRASRTGTEAPARAERRRAGLRRCSLPCREAAAARGVQTETLGDLFEGAASGRKQQA